jgi:hypothetical protein
VWPPLYSSSIALATQAKEWLYGVRQIWLATHKIAPGKYVAGRLGDIADWDWWDYYAVAETEAEAICLALLSAVESEGT